jgi:hypothetical protein
MASVDRGRPLPCFWWRTSRMGRSCSVRSLKALPVQTPGSASTHARRPYAGRRLCRPSRATRTAAWPALAAHQLVVLIVDRGGADPVHQIGPAAEAAESFGIEHVLDLGDVLEQLLDRLAADLDQEVAARRFERASIMGFAEAIVPDQGLLTALRKLSQNGSEQSPFK